MAFSGCINSSDTHKNVDENKDRSTPLTSSDLTIDSDGLSTIKAIVKTVHGNFIIKFYPAHAPNTVTRVLHLIDTGFYDGLSFHRAIPGFIIQTGDPSNSGKGGSGITLKAEFNSLQHIKGTVAMARTNSNEDSADSQFYISLATLPRLNGKYTIFAQVVEGTAVLDQITKQDKILSIQIK